MRHAVSADGARIAFETVGEGRPLVLVGGAFCDRHAKAAGTPLARLLADRFSVVSYDRRGRGDSTDVAPWSIARELDDLDAVIGANGGRAFVYGMSSGALIALAAAERGAAIDGLVLYEAPIVLDDAKRPSEDLARELDDLLRADRRSDAAALFLARVVGLPPGPIAGMKAAPMWAALERIATTLPHDVRLAAGAPDLLARAHAVETPTCTLSGEGSPTWMRDAARALGDALPNGHRRELRGQTHDVDPSVLADAIADVLSGDAASPSRSRLD